MLTPVTALKRLLSIQQLSARQLGALTSIRKAELLNLVSEQDEQLKQFLQNSLANEAPLDSLFHLPAQQVYGVLNAVAEGNETQISNAFRALINQSQPITQVASLYELLQVTRELPERLSLPNDCLPSINLAGLSFDDALYLSMLQQEYAQQLEQLQLSFSIEKTPQANLGVYNRLWKRLLAKENLTSQHLRQIRDYYNKRGNPDEALQLFSNFLEFCVERTPFGLQTARISLCLIEALEEDPLRQNRAINSVLPKIEQLFLNNPDLKQYHIDFISYHQSRINRILGKLNPDKRKELRQRWQAKRRSARAYFLSHPPASRTARQAPQPEPTSTQPSGWQQIRERVRFSRCTDLEKWQTSMLGRESLENNRYAHAYRAHYAALIAYAKRLHETPNQATRSELKQGLRNLQTILIIARRNLPESQRFSEIRE